MYATDPLYVSITLTSHVSVLISVCFSPKHILPLEQHTENVFAYI